MQTQKCYLCDLRLTSQSYSYSNRRLLRLSDGSMTKICDDCALNETIACHHCGYLHLKKDNVFTVINNSNVCQNCIDNHYYPCDGCSNLIVIRYSRNIDDKHYCQNCFNLNYFTCYHCADNFHLESSRLHRDNYYCSDCYDQIINTASFGDRKRDYSKEVITSPTMGDIVKSDFSFGVELECVINNTDLAEALKELPDSLGVTPDGSVDNGGEFITPPLQHKQGETYLKDVCATLQKNNASINTSCGTHCHIAIPESYKKPTILQAIMMSYVAFEPILLSMLPPQRRNNHYAIPVSKKYTLEDIAKIKTSASLDRIWYKSDVKQQRDRRKTNKYDDSRYCGLNIHALLYNGKTLEVRYHSGTINADKILHWVAVNTCLIKLATNKKFVADIQTSENRLKTFFDYSKDELTNETKEYVISRIAKFKKHNNTTNICAE